MPTDDTWDDQDEQPNAFGVVPTHAVVHTCHGDVNGPLNMCGKPGYPTCPPCQVVAMEFDLIIAASFPTAD